MKRSLLLLLVFALCSTILCGQAESQNPELIVPEVFLARSDD
ncbi:MAG: hypothetical protein RBR90_03075 [Candidatus Cloacimonadaceae bacterium]|nr:hypothetical protein [Candidatus Cloacimonadaceae bacterium]